MNTLEPVFGDMYEVDVVFPNDSILNIKLMDYDLLSGDDLIGETTIDLENRYHSAHKGMFGLQSTYEEYGYNIWRLSLKPTQILNKLCKDYKLELPCYMNERARFMGKDYVASSEIEMENGDMKKNCYENQALEILKDWHNVVEDGHPLVMEHIETRNLYKQEKPGMIQG